MPREGKPTPRVREHLETLRAAGLDTQAFFEALVRVRDDSTLSETHRQAIYKCVAMESFAWYLDALNGEPINRVEAMRAARSAADAGALSLSDSSSLPNEDG